MSKMTFYFVFILFLFMACTRNNKNHSVDDVIEIYNNININTKTIINENINDDNQINTAFVEYYFDLSDTLFYYYYKRPNRPKNIENGMYFILEFNVSIRDQPNLNGEIIGQLNLNDEIEVIENMRHALLFNEVLQYWYKIKFKDIIGYIWGGSIAFRDSDINYSIINFDIDKNGINDYFFYRIAYEESYQSSEVYYHFFNVVTPDDIFIYINNERINNQEFINKYTNDVKKYWNICFFRNENWASYDKEAANVGAVELDIGNGAAGDIFWIYPNGRIEFISHYRP